MAALIVLLIGLGMACNGEHFGTGVVLALCALRVMTSGKNPDLKIKIGDTDEPEEDHE